MAFHCPIFNVRMMLVHCVDNDCIWGRVTLVFVLRLNPLHVSSCEVVAWLAHLWWRLSCLSQRFSYVTSDAWSRNVIRLCGITVCVWAVTDLFSFMEILIFSISLCNAHPPTTLTPVLETSSRLYPAVYMLPHSSGKECVIKQDFISNGMVDTSYDSLQLWWQTI